MSVKIRMTRMGRRHRPFFRINAVDSRTPRDGRILEKLGHYDPLEKDESKQIVLDREKVQAWLDKGAVPSDTVGDILKARGMTCKVIEDRDTRKAKAREIARKKGVPFNTADRVAITKAAESAKSEAEAKAAAEAEAAKKAEEEDREE